MTSKLKKQMTSVTSIRNDQPPKKSILSKKKIWMGVLILIILAGGGGYLYYRFGYLPNHTSTTTSLQTAVVRQGDLSLSASGTGILIPVDEVSFGFETGGEVVEVLVSLGDKVDAGQLLACLDDTSALDQLAQAQRALREMTSPASIAVARQAVVTAEENLIIVQKGRDYLNGTYSQALIDNAYADMVLANANLTKVQERYDKVADLPFEDERRASAYTALYDAQSAYDSAKRLYVIYDSYSASVNDIELADANLALAQATLDEAKYYLAALTAGEVQEDATGSNLTKLEQAWANVDSARKTLEAINLYAPISGTIMALNIGVGDNLGSGAVVTIDDLSKQRLDIYLDESDWEKLKVGYAVEVIFDSLPEIVYTGKVVEVDPSLFTQGMSSAIHGVVELDIPKDGFNLLIGMSAAVDVISTQAKNTILIPVEALREISSDEYAVFVMENGEPVVHMVEVGIQDLYSVEIISGLKVGEIVTTGIVETK
jgi:HlyD family secretion protein